MILILILIIVLIIVVIYLYNQTLIENKKESYTSQTSQCNRNCGNYNIDTTSTNISGCLSCGYCGVCTLPNNSQICMNGDASGAYFNLDCSGSNWNFGSGVINSIGLNYEDQLANMGQTDNLPSQATNVSYDISKTPMYHSDHSDYSDQTINALADLLDKINRSNQQNSNNSNDQNTNDQNTIDQNTIQQLQQILNQLKSSTS